jgi:hypothetical protein
LAAGLPSLSYRRDIKRAMAVVLAPHLLGIEIPGTNNGADSGEPYDRRMRPGETAETLI